MIAKLETSEILSYIMFYNISHENFRILKFGDSLLMPGHV